MPLLDELFADLESVGQVHRVAGRSMTAEQLKDADVLLVRSVTSVTRQLLENTPVKFVGSATIGTDHVDRDYLREAGITFAYAPGCNAQAVAEYVLAAMGYWYADQCVKSNFSVGIIGAGNVGTKVSQCLQKLGIEHYLNDPPLQQAGDKRQFVGLEKIKQCDVISCHVPLTKDGPFPTYHLIDEAFLSDLKPNSLLINSARGAVVDNSAAINIKHQRDDIALILDVWENEPALNTELLDRCLLGTPHIAGYSLQGKMRGSYMLYQALCDFLNIKPRHLLKDILPQGRLLNLQHGLQQDFESIVEQLPSFYDIKLDDNALRQVQQNVAKEFDKLRKNYPTRLEFLTL